MDRLGNPCEQLGYYTVDIEKPLQISELGNDLEVALGKILE